MSSTVQATRYPVSLTKEDFVRNLASVRERVALACERAGRCPSDVRILPVSKTIDVGRIRLAYAAGYRELAENKIQEAWEKSHALSDLDGVRWSVIGHLQTNKAKYVARFASEFHALDSLRLAEELDRQLEREGRNLNVYVQVNTSGEASKYGLTPEQVHDFLRQLVLFPRLRVQGLMTIAVNSNDTALVRACFKTLSNLRAQLEPDAPAGVELGELSMGMSGDFEIAVEEGATVVRVGQAIFGARSTPDYFYWPLS